MVSKKSCRHLILILGDQLNQDSAIFDDFDADQDAVWMAEVAEESEHVWSHKARITIFLSAMRHFRNAMESYGYQIHYRQLDDSKNQGSLVDELRLAIKRLKPERLVMVRPGEWRIQNGMQALAKELDLELSILPDRHFLSTPEEFAEHAEGRKQLRQEYFYRELRRKHDILMTKNDKPVGGSWNYDSDNRKSFGKSGPKHLPKPCLFEPDEITQEVIRLVEKEFPEHPGSLDHFSWPVTPDEAQEALNDFIKHRLPTFGDHQDAMWTDEPFLFHSRISSSLNLKLLDPKVAIERAAEAYEKGLAPLNSVEGFVRQILGWREYVRGIYWLYMPNYLERNTLSAQQPLPDFFWTGETEMHCLSQTIGQTLEHGYAHHIQRLMVTGLFCLLLGVDPKLVHEWYLAVYVDAVEWVELPNSLGMSQFADDGVMASKPYVATGKYIQRMSNYCKSCQYDPAESVGEKACPFTTLYWDFLARHQDLLKSNTRMGFQLKNLDRKSDEELKEIANQADKVRERLG